jgi:protein involved in polysaccharide export with SLBB domain
MKFQLYKLLLGMSLLFVSQFASADEPYRLHHGDAVFVSVWGKKP